MKTFNFFKQKRFWAYAGGIVGFSLALALLMNVSWGDLPPDIEVGRIAHQDIRADKDYEIVDEEATHLRDEKVQQELPPVVIKIQAGESIIRRGDRFESRHVKIVNGIRKEKAKTFGRTHLLGNIFFVFLFLSLFFLILERNIGKGRLQSRDLLFLGSLLLISVALTRSSVFISGAVHDLLPVDIPLSSFYALIPVAAGTMIVRFILPLPMSLFFALVSSVFSGLILQGNLYYSLFYLMGSVAAIQWMKNIRSRGQVLRVGIQLGLWNAFVLLALDLLNVTSISDAFVLQDVWFRMGMAFLGGPISAGVALILMPAFESIFNYLTSIKLLEYGSLNHPILREMIVRSPGTYHHSHMVGTLAEAACEAIGADSLFARVASYFHDIGKMKKSSYFIENQSVGEDRHATLSPSMSALIISAHVKDGMDLAREYKLPQRIIDIIPQHQGTKLISYFYNKAKEAENKGLHVIDEKDYRYPGPKPQTREAGVILLADTTEASTRALKDRSPARLREVVRNMINKNFIDGQLDECELTLKDLNAIANSFVRILIGIYHQRIEYPPDQQDEAVRDKAAGSASTLAYEDKYSESKPICEDSLHEVIKLSEKSRQRSGTDKSGN